MIMIIIIIIIIIIIKKKNNKDNNKNNNNNNWRVQKEKANKVRPKNGLEDNDEFAADMCPD